MVIHYTDTGWSMSSQTTAVAMCKIWKHSCVIWSFTAHFLYVLFAWFFKVSYPYRHGGKTWRKRRKQDMVNRAGKDDELTLSRAAVLAMVHEESLWKHLQTPWKYSLWVPKQYRIITILELHWTASKWKSEYLEIRKTSQLISLPVTLQCELCMYYWWYLKGTRGLIRRGFDENDRAVRGGLGPGVLSGQEHWQIFFFFYGFC